MITPTTKDPYTLAEELGVPIVYRKLAGGLHAYWDGARIIVDTRLSQTQERCAITHDLMHVIAGDEPYLHVLSSPSIEAKRDLQAAELLIDPAAFRQAATMYPDDGAKVARELGITNRLLNAWVRAHGVELIELDEVA